MLSGKAQKRRQGAAFGINLVALTIGITWCHNFAAVGAIHRAACGRGWRIGQHRTVIWKIMALPAGGAVLCILGALAMAWLLGVQQV